MRGLRVNDNGRHLKIYGFFCTYHSIGENGKWERTSPCMYGKHCFKVHMGKIEGDLVSILITRPNRFGMLIEGEKRVSKYRKHGVICGDHRIDGFIVVDFFDKLDKDDMEISSISRLNNLYFVPIKNVI